MLEVCTHGSDGPLRNRVSRLEDRAGGSGGGGGGGARGGGEGGGGWGANAGGSSDRDIPHTQSVNLTSLASIFL